MAVGVGDKAPGFSLRSKGPEGVRDVTLESLLDAGPVVLFFFPGAFTGVCTEELCTVSKDLQDWTDLGGSSVGISVDAPLVQEAFARANNIDILLLSDFSRKTIADYGLVAEDFFGTGGTTSKRAIVIVGQDGLVKYVQVTPNLGDMPDFAAAKQALADI